MARALEAGKLIIGAIAVSVDPTGTAATALGIDTVLQIKNWLTGKPDLAKLAKRLDKDFQTELASPRFDKPADARTILPQMLEASMPSAQTIAACGLDAEQILAAMHKTLSDKDSEYRKYENVKAFDALVRPLLETACNDPDLEAALRPHLTRILHQKQDTQTRLLEQLIAQTQNNPGLSLEARELARTERLINRIAEKHLAKTPDDPLLALEEIGRTLERFAEQSKRTQQGSNLDQNVQDSLSRSDALAREGNIPAALDEITQAEAEIADQERALTAARETLLRQRLMLADLDSDPLAAAQCEVSLLRLRLGHAPKIQQIVDRARELEADFNRFGNYFAGLTARALLQDAYERAAPEDHPDVVLGQLANATASLAQHASEQTLFSEAIGLFKEHAAMVPKSLLPDAWATAQNNLGTALQDQGIRTEGQDGADLLAEAVAAYRSALEIRTKGALPVNWATTQNNLGAALQEQGSRTEGPAGADLLAKAVTAYRSALEVYTMGAHPVHWATTQNNLGNALQQQGSRTEGPGRADLLAEAVAASRSALEVRTKAAHPVDWAMTQNNLGNALSEQGTRTEGPGGADLLAEAVAACRSALEVYTRDAHPVHWALTQENIALAEEALAEHHTTSDPRPHLEAAWEAVTAALTVFDPVHMSYNHAKATRLRDDIAAKLEALPPG